MKPKSIIEKGKRFEKFICQEIEAEGLGKSIRTPGSGSGKIKGDTFNNLDFMLECKNEKQTNFLPNVDQAKSQARIGNYDSGKWALITRDPRTPESSPEVYATIDLWEFLRLLKKNNEPRIKEPDRSLKYALERLRQSCQEVIKQL